jgi:hypothetical protein
MFYYGFFNADADFRLAKWTILKAGAVYLPICQAAVRHET